VDQNNWKDLRVDNGLINRQNWAKSKHMLIHKKEKEGGKVIQKAFSIKQESEFKNPDNIEKLREELVNAISEEIKVIDQKGTGSSRYQITNGEFVKQEGEYYIYRFAVDEIIELPDDLPVEVKLSNTVVKGFIITIGGFEITLAMTEDLGKFIASATLLSSAKFLLEKIRSILEDPKKINSRFNYQIIERLFGLRQTSLTESKSSESLPVKIRNYRQERAIRSSLDNEILFIWGPPGTGKTTTLGNIVRCYVERHNNNDDKILVLSHTNVATDRAAQKIIECSKSEDYLIEGKVVRFGNIIEGKNSVLKEEDVTLVRLSDIARRKTDQLSREREKQAIKLKNLTDENKKVERLLFEKQQTKQYFDKLGRTKAYLNEKELEKDNTLGKIRQYEVSLQGVEERIKKAENSNKIRRFFSGLNIPKLTLQKTEIMRNINNLQEKAKNLQQEIIHSEDVFHNLKREYFRSYNALHFIHENRELINENTLLSKLENENSVIVVCFDCEQKLRVKNEKLIFSCPKCKYEAQFFPIKNRRNINWHDLQAKKEDNLSQVKDINGTIKALDEKIREIKDGVVKEAKVIITTITQSYSSQIISSMNFSVIIIDEASMVPLPIMFFASGLSLDKVIVIGDFKQLAPIANSKNRYLHTDIFKFSGLQENIKEKGEDQRMVALNEQFRMHPAISEICNTLVYQPYHNELEDALDVKNRNNDGILKRNLYPDEPIVFCDTSCSNPWCTSTPSGSCFNLYHAILIVRMIEKAVNEDISENRIGIITPYKAQAKFINKIRRTLLPEVKKVKVSTVHKFQGLENEIIIFDTVISRGKKHGPGFFYDGSDESDRMLNVAITRAKAKLIIVGDGAYLNSRLKDDSLMFKALDHFKNRNKVFSSENIMKDYYEEMVLSKKAFRKNLDKALRPRYFGIFDESNFYEVFEEDLLGVEKGECVLIYSPFIQFARVSKLMDVLKVIMDKGAKLIIFTEKRYKNIELFDDSVKEALNYLEDVGAVIKYRPNIHQKRAFISGRIWWEGSLNIFSHSRTEEDMLRFSQKEIIEEVINNFGLGNLIGVGRVRLEEKNKWRALIRNVLKEEEKKCEKCGERLGIRFGRFGIFLGCNNRECQETANIPINNLKYRIDGAHIRCPEGGCKGYIQVKVSRKGKKISTFLGCSNYPNCKYILPLR
jgi:hypothetical protein